MHRLHSRYNLILAAVWTSLLLCACSGKSGADSAGIKTRTPSPEDTAAVNALLARAASFNQTNFDSMRFYADIAYKRASTSNDLRGMAGAQLVQANFFRRMGDYTDAVSTALKATTLYDSLNLIKDLVKAKTLLSDFYKEMGGEKDAVPFQQQALALAREAERLAETNNDMPGLTNALNMEGIIVRDMSKTSGKPELMDSAFVYYNRGVEIIQQSGEGSENLGKLYNNISQVYNEYFKNYDKALEYQMKAVAFNKQRNNKISLTYNYNTIAEIYRNKGNYPLARQYALDMLVISREMKAPFRLVNGYSALTTIYKAMGRYDSALYYAETGNKLADSLNSLAKSSQIANAQTRYETGKKEAEISYLSDMNKAKSQRMLMISIAAGVLLLLLGVVWFQKRRSQLQKIKIAEQSDKLQWMMKELHHRVKNNLQIVSSLLNLQSYRMKDEESQSAIRESQLRVQAMSLMHQRLYQVDDVSMVNFKLYLTDLAETLMRAYGFQPDDFDLQIDIEKEMLDVDTVMPMGLLVNEIITNSFKYAYTDVKHPVLQIKLTDSGKQIQLDICDNGPGIQTPAGAKPGFGQKLITALSSQLKAKFTVTSDRGTHYSFIIPQSTKAA